MPSSPRYRRSLPIVVLVVALLTAGCVAVPGDSVTGEEIADRLENDEVPSEVSATLEVRTVVDGETTQYEEDVWLRGGTTRIETGDGDLIVSDGDRRWHHEPETDSVQYIEVDPDSQSMLEGCTDSKNGISPTTRTPSPTSRKPRSTAARRIGSRSIRRKTRR